VGVGGIPAEEVLVEGVLVGSVVVEAVERGDR